jgi:hypothetical protein
MGERPDRLDDIRRNWDAWRSAAGAAPGASLAVSALDGRS